MSNLKEIFKEEMKISIKKLGDKGKQVSKEYLEDVALEVIDMIGRVVEKTDGKIDDFYLLIKDQLQKIADKIDGKEG